MRTKGFFDKPNVNLNTIVLPDIPIWLIDEPVIDLNIFFLCRKNDNTYLIRSCFSNVIDTDYADFTLFFLTVLKVSMAPVLLSLHRKQIQKDQKRLIALDLLFLPSFMLFCLLYIG